MTVNWGNIFFKWNSQALSQALSKADQSGTTQTQRKRYNSNPDYCTDETQHQFKQEIPQPTKTPDNPSVEQPVVNPLAEGKLYRVCNGIIPDRLTSLTIKMEKLRK